MKRRGDDRRGNHEKREKLDSSAFQVIPITRFQQQFPTFRKPVEVGYFSHDSERQLKFTKEQLKYYTPPENPHCVEYDLAKGYETFIQKDDSVKEYIDAVLKWILANTEKFQVRGSQQANVKTGDLSTDFVCWRGTLTRLLCTPYENRDGWICAVTKFNNTWYLCEFDSEGKIHQRLNMDERGKKMTYGGWKFEQYVVADSPADKPDTSRPVNNKEAFCSVVRSRLAQHSFVFGGEVDCTGVQDHKAHQSEISKKYVELKTNFEFKHKGQERNFKRFKLIKMWAQSFLIGIDRIVVGFRDEQGVVRRLEDINTLDIPNMIKDLHNPWEPTVCFNFLDQFLHHVKQTVTNDDPKSCFVFRFEPGKDITSTYYPGKSDFTFLPDWYIQDILIPKDRN